MSAYDMRQRGRSARLLNLEPGPPTRSVTSQHGSILARSAKWTESVSLTIDELLDCLVDRLADAVIARISNGRVDEGDEWLDSRQAAEYLGLHRDTLRRLAAARAIPSEQDGRGCKLFFRQAALDEWRRSGGRPRHLTAVANAA
jgi:excisionase family DNA binding protein